MKTSVIGFPRVGALRELKFATEKYFRKEIGEEQLQDTAKELRKKHWQLLQKEGISFIPCNDFSFYDGVLDTAVALGVIPKRYRELNLSRLDTYFAMARGYQTAEGDVKALAMKKWFNTNYHYIVPELEDDMVISFDGTKLFGEWEEAKKAGVDAKAVIVGPYTFLKLARTVGKKEKKSYVAELITAYRELIAQADEKQVSWLQFDEPCLVQDVDEEEKALFLYIYRELLAQKKNVKVLLQTYFGDVRDIYQDITGLAFDGIGLDFLEGTETADLVEKYGFPKDKYLFAGLVNGKNIWKNHYQKTLETLQNLKNAEIDVVLNTSCSLLHVPFTLENETKLSKEYTKYFAFAVEKLEELKELGLLADKDDYKEDPAFQANKDLFASDRKCSDPAVVARVAGIQDKDYVRLPKRAERQKLQKEEFGLPLFPTTTIGSFPQTKDVKANRSAYKKGEISKEQYEAFNKKKIADCVKLQEEIGLDVLVHGEYERNDMVEYFGESLEGYLFTEKAWVQSYGTRCVKPPIIWGDVSRKNAITVSWSSYAQSLTDKLMKGMLTGPVTIFNWSFPREDISPEESVTQIALAIRDEVLDLEKNGIRVIQIDEAALREKLPLRKSDWNKKYLDWAIPAFRLVHSGVKKETQIHTHMCYSEFTDIIPAIDDMDADVITFEASRSDLLILDALKENHFETEVGPGVYDIHSPRVPSVEEIVNALHKMLEKIEPEKLWVNPDCGLKTRGEKETTASLKNLVEAAKEIRAEYK